MGTSFGSSSLSLVAFPGRSPDESSESLAGPGAADRCRCRHVGRLALAVILVLSCLYLPGPISASPDLAQRDEDPDADERSDFEPQQVEAREDIPLDSAEHLDRPESSRYQEPPVASFGSADDPDGDGLTTTQETLIGTDPYNVDSDCDAVSDGDEVGPNPSTPVDTDLDGIIDALESSKINSNASGAVDQSEASVGWQLSCGRFLPFAIPNNNSTATRVEVSILGGSNVSAVSIASSASLVGLRVDGVSLSAGVPIVLYNDGTKGDRIAGDHIWSRGSFTSSVSLTTRGIDYTFDQVTVTDDSGTSTKDLDTVLGGSFDRFQIGVVPTTSIESITSSSEPLQVTGHAMNLIDPQLALRVRQVMGGASVGTLPRDLSKRFYRYFPDDFDFLLFWPDFPAAPGGLFGVATVARNFVTGTGRSLFDNTDLFGSQGRLQNSIVLNLAANGPTLHEMLHVWSNYTGSLFGLGQCSPGHWGVAGVGEGQHGGFDPSTLVDNLNGTYSVASHGLQANGGDSVPFAPLERYLAGFLDPSQLAPIPVPVNVNCSSRSSSGGVVTFAADGIDWLTIGEIESALGVRDPDWTESQKSFRSAYVIVSQRPLVEAEMAYIGGQARIMSGEAAGNGLYSFSAASGAGTTMGTDLVMPPLPPPAPSGISATDGSFSDKVRVTWPEVAGATSYRLYRTLPLELPVVPIDWAFSSPYDDSTAEPDVQYNYWVAACNAKGCSSVVGPDPGERRAATDVYWVALGDSYSSGEGAGSYGATDNRHDNECHRSAYAWSGDAPGKNEDARVLPTSTYRQLVACSGATSEHLLEANFFDEDPNANGTCEAGEPCVRPQLHEANLADADLVTMTLGGNDTQSGGDAGMFATLVKKCVLASDCTPPHEPFTWAESLQAYLCKNLAVLNGPADFEGSLRNRFAAVKAAAPNASIWTLLYPRLFVDDPIGSECGNEGFEEVEMAWLNDVADALKGIASCAAEDVGINVVDVDFGEHAHCQDNDWDNDWLYLHGVYFMATFNADVNIFVDPLSKHFVWSRSRESMHPTRLGQAAIARALGRALPQGGTTWLDPGNPASGQCPSFQISEDLCPTSLAVPAGVTQNLVLGELDVASIAGTCGVMEHGFAPSQLVSLSGSGFAPGAQVSLGFAASTGGFEQSLGQVPATASGGLATEVVIPAGAPTSGAASLSASGLDPGGNLLVLSYFTGLVPSTTADQDFDGIPDLCDNCRATGNSEQLDSDGDGIGDVCDPCPEDSDNDEDLDGICSAVDPCPLDPLNDSDGDGLCAEADFCNGVADPACFFASNFESGGTCGWSNGACP
jgi:hypothetical protein